MFDIKQRAIMALFLCRCALFASRIVSFTANLLTEWVFVVYHIETVELRRGAADADPGGCDPAKGTGAHDP